MTRHKWGVKVLVSTATIALMFTPATSVLASGFGAFDYKFCNPRETVFCDNFLGKTFYKDQTDRAHWYRYPFNKDGAVSYNNVYPVNVLRLQVDENSTVNNYSNADISTSEINNYQGNFLFGVNTRAEVRMKYSASMLANPASMGDTARGSAGFLFWNYFTGPVDPEFKDLTKVRDAFGFVWQDNHAVPTPGFWVVSVAQGVPGAYLPYFNIDLSQFHKYAIERRHDSIKFFIDDQLVHTIPLNQTGGLTLPDDSKLSTDMWVDNATYVLDFNTFKIDLDFNHLTQKESVDIDYVKVTSLD